ncbi:MAG TPA: methionine--tRNA ligase [Dinghuibacter sp.]|uniref:methionine--tRNA ligase n=1 Tax=Dinghuibacter sp. TaxID=2024697 RepID=UPI002B55F9EF|nr:methionine--tRNA ligase [Dinghuibacter sp.]HTJ11581.1 methionine--tRNA ligase [Dinghuibacter sp.]
MVEFKRYLVTAALPYANGPVHIGHLAGCYLPADIYVRYQRARKQDIKFICGSDEHGVPITIRAMREGITPQQVVDKYNAIIKDSFARMGISFDIYSRTSNPVHHETASAFFKKLYDDGLFEEKESEQYYDEEKKTFLADRYIIGTCPVCANPNAYGDQCERCGSSLSPDQLINPRSALSDATPVLKKTKHWYFPLQQYEPWLKEWIVEGKKDVWKNNVYGQCKSWLDSGLQPRAMTRDSNWGIKVPLPDAEGKVLYVWFDAPIGYISATKELTPDWADYWCKGDTKLVHFIGKDNIVFHCIIFPSMLKAHGGFVLPDNVPANEFLNIEGEKVSTSRNWAVWVDEYLRDFPDGQDVLRYVLCANAPETKDNDFTWKDFQTRNNSELVAIFGNFVNRTMVMMHKLCGGKVPPLHADVLDDEDRAMLEAPALTRTRVEAALETYRFREALSEVIALSSEGNKYLQKKQPWIVARDLPTDPTAQKKIDNCLHVCLQLTANLAILINPFLPFSARKMSHMMKTVDKMLEWENAGKTKLLSVGYSLRPPELLFAKIEDAQVEAQVAKLRAGLVASAAATAPAPAAPAAPTPLPEVKSTIVYDDFAKLDLRVGKILTAEKMPKSDKLLRFTVDLGVEQRTILSGVAKHFDPAALIGQQVTVVANLAPRKMMGVESHGMILMAEDPGGKLHFINPQLDIAPGSTIS